MIALAWNYSDFDVEHKLNESKSWMDHKRFEQSVDDENCELKTKCSSHENCNALQ